MHKTYQDILTLSVATCCAALQRSPSSMARRVRSPPRWGLPRMSWSKRKKRWTYDLHILRSLQKWCTVANYMLKLQTQTTFVALNFRAHKPDQSQSMLTGGFWSVAEQMQCNFYLTHTSHVSSRPASSTHWTRVLGAKKNYINKA